MSSTIAIQAPIELFLTSGDIPYSLGEGCETARCGTGIRGGALGASCGAFVEAPSEDFDAALAFPFATSAAICAAGPATQK